MQSSLTAILFAALSARVVVAAGVTGSAIGFAKGTTGGGAATPETPSSLAQ